MNDTDNAKDKVQAQARKVKEEAHDIGGAVKDRALEIGKNLKSKSGNYTKIAADKAGDLKDGVLEWVKENPGKSIGIAFLVGWLYAKK